MGINKMQLENVLKNIKTKNISENKNMYQLNIQFKHI